MNSAFRAPMRSRLLQVTPIALAAVTLLNTSPVLAQSGASNEVQTITVTGIRRAIESAIPALDPQDSRTLHLKGLTRIPTDAYLAVPNPPAPKAIAPTD